VMEEEDGNEAVQTYAASFLCATAVHAAAWLRGFLLRLIGHDCRYCDVSAVEW